MYIYRTNFFKLEELVYPEIFKERGDLCWELLDTRILSTIDTLRYNLNIPLTINNYHIGGDRQFSGLRPFGNTIGAKNSQHNFGRAMDIISKDMSAEDMRKHIIQNQKLYPYVTFIEDYVSWLHIDVRNSPFNMIRLFKVHR